MTVTESKQFETILLEEEPETQVATITFNRPSIRNAMNFEMVQDVRAALDGLSLREQLAAVIFTGAGGKSFISGADIGELRERTRADALARVNSRLFREIECFPAPTIAAIRGYALGGGCELAIACDLRVAGVSARLGQPEVGLGIIPGAGATYRLPRLIGLGRARELIFTGRILDAEEALRIGLVNQVVPDDDVLEAAHALASRIAKNSQLAVRASKTLLNASAEMSIDTASVFESATQAILFEAPDKYERMSAFLARRKKGKG